MLDRFSPSSLYTGHAFERIWRSPNWYFSYLCLGWTLAFLTFSLWEFFFLMTSLFTSYIFFFLYICLLSFNHPYQLPLSILCFFALCPTSSQPCMNFLVLFTFLSYKRLCETEAWTEFSSSFFQPQIIITMWFIFWRDLLTKCWTVFTFSILSQFPVKCS